MFIFTAHSGEHLIAHLGELLTILPCLFLQPIQLIFHRLSICAFTAHQGAHLIAHLGEFLTVHPCVLLQPIPVNILLFNANQDKFLKAQCAQSTSSGGTS
jgi:hypothetical protein